MGNSDLRADARRVLEAAWVPEAGYCVPHRSVYPHLWLWDSCFHSLGWLGVDDGRASQELSAIFVAQTANGFVPHMRYLGRPTYKRGPRPDASSLTQPPVYGIVIERLVAAGHTVPQPLIDSAGRGLRYLWQHRRSTDDLITIFHPWESGADDSPRWDDWVHTTHWRRWWFRLFDRYALARVRFDNEPAAIGSTLFASTPAAFNAIFACSADCLGRITADAELLEMSLVVADAMDRVLWHDDEGLWDDKPLVGGGDRQRVPTLDGVLPALVTADHDRAARALAQVVDQDRFGALYGPRYVPVTHPAYNPNAYWRGPAWPQLNYLVWLAAHRCGRRDIATNVEQSTRRGVSASHFAEYWNAESGAARGAVPQTWATVVTAMTDRLAPE